MVKVDMSHTKVDKNLSLASRLERIEKHITKVR
jgi:hypothetical protein